jgi:hypothetical protein
MQNCELCISKIIMPNSEYIPAFLNESEDEI